MKTRMFALAGAVFSACLTGHAAFRTEATIRPTGESDQYEVAVRLIEVDSDGATDVLAAPRITVKAGQEAQVNTGDEKGENGFFCTVLVTETEDGVQATTTVVMKERGAEVSNSTHVLSIRR